jgi:hypothetical protein
MITLCRRPLSRPAHHLDDECPLMARCRAAQGIQRFHDAVQGGVRADGHVGTGHVVVDGPDQPDQSQKRVRGSGLGRQLAGLDKFAEQFLPFLPEQVGPGQAAVTTDHHQRVDATLDHVPGRRAPALPGAEGLGPGGADRRTAALQDAGDVGRFHPLDQLAALDEPQIALVDRIHVDAVMQGGPDHGPHRRIHPGGVAAAGQNANAGGRGACLDHG